MTSQLAARYIRHHFRLPIHSTPMHQRITELVDYLNTGRAALLDSASTLPPERWTEHPGAGRWSVANLLEHLQIVEQSCTKVIAKRAAEARAAGHPAETETSSKLDQLDSAGLLNRSVRLEAPARVVPTGTLSGDVALAGITQSRAELLAAIAVADGLALESVRATHGRLGEIDLYQWILFIGQHEHRHVEQMAEIVSQLGATAARS